MKNKILVFLLFLIGVLIVLITLIYLGLIEVEKENYRYKKEKEKISLLYDRMSYPILLSINKDDDKLAKNILIGNLTDLVFNYEKELFSQTKGLSDICTDWNDGLRKIILQYMEKTTFDGTIYQTEVLKKSKLIDVDCNRTNRTNLNL